VREAARQWALSALGALVSVSVPVTLYQAGAGPLAVQAAVLLPGVVTLVLLRQGRTWYRWAAIFLLAQVVDPWALTIFLLVADAWALHLAWFATPRRWRLPRPRLLPLAATARKGH